MYSFSNQQNTWRSQILDGSLLMKIIFINAGVYLLVNTVALLALWFNVDSFLIYYSTGGYTSKLTYWLAASSSVLVMLKQPWSLISYMFLHEGFMHLLFNMVFLYFSGRIFIQFLGEKRFFSAYIFGGLSGFVLYFLAYNLIPYFNSDSGVPILGASASVMSVFIGIAAYQPSLPVRLPLVGSVPLKYVAIFYLVMDYVSIQNGENVGGHIAHLGGAIYGFWAISRFRKGQDVFYNILPLIDRIGQFFRPKSKLKVKYKRRSTNRYASSSSARPVSDETYNYNKKKEQEKVDEILDKISKSGYDSLSAKEKDFLFHQSTKNQH